MLQVIVVDQRWLEVFEKTELLRTLEKEYSWGILDEERHVLFGSIVKYAGTVLYNNRLVQRPIGNYNDNLKK